MVKVILLVIASINFMSLSAYSSSASDAINMNEGRWEITTTMEMANLPFQIPPMSHTTCLTKNDLIPQDNEQNRDEDCKVTEQSVKGNTVSWTIVCNTDEGKTTSSGTITYKGNSFTGKINMQMPGTGTVSQKLAGRRLGSCD